MSKILIKNGKVWDGERFYFADILTDNRLIVSVAPGIDEDADYVYDATDKIVSAGLVDIHTHMLGGFGINAEMSCIPFGVTSAADVCAEYGFKEKYDNFLVKNKVFVCSEFKDNKFIYENMVKTLEYYGEKAHGIKVFFDTEISEVCDISPLEEIARFAHERSLSVMVHSSNSPTKMRDIVSVLDKDDILTHAFHGGTNTAEEDNFECLKLAKEKGIIVDAGFAGNVHTDFGIFERAVRNGIIPDTISTDITRFSAYKRGGRYGMTMCMSMAKNVGMSEEDIFRGVTSAPAKALGKENEWGYLKVGRCADISVFDYTGEAFSLTDGSGNTICDENSYNCIFCICNGELVYRN